MRAHHNMGNFIKQTFASLVGNLIALVIVAVLGAGGLVFLLAIAATQDTEPRVKNKSVLVLDLSWNISDSPPQSTASEAISDALAGETNNTIALRMVLDAIEEAAEDRRIVGLYLKGSSLSSNNGWATLMEVRKALEEFRKTEKPIIAYDTDWEERELYLASVADTLAINPLGVMELDGFSSEVTFYGGAFEKYGIGVQVLRAGKYKAAVEPFLLDKRSPENREQTQKLLGDLWTEFRQSVGASRKLEAADLQRIADEQGILMADEALQEKLADQVVHADRIIADLKDLTGEKKDKRSFRQISLPTYARVIKGDRDESSKREVAIVYAEGVIVDGKGEFEEIGGDRLAKELRQVRLNDDVKAVVLRINSPGGSATASEVIQREVALIRKAKKPLIVSMGDVAASGGYWIATDADRIFAEPTTITGSIGVFGLFLNIQELGQTHGITWDAVKTARFADNRTLSRPRTPEELARYQKIVDLIYDRFLEKVSKTRKLPKEKVHEISQGRVWSGIAAKELGLVDEIGGLDSAVQAAAKHAKLGDDWTVREYPKTRSWEDRLLEQLSGEEVQEPKDVLTQEWLKFQEDLTFLKTLNDPVGVYARLPYHVRIE